MAEDNNTPQDQQGNPYEFMGVESAEQAQQTWQETQAKIQEADQYKQQLSQYDGYVKPANDFVNRLNDYFSKGASQEEVQQFIEVQRLDLEQSDPAELIKRNMRLSNPSLSADDAEVLFKNKYATPNEEDFSGGKEDPKYKEALRLRDALMRQDSHEARKSLEKLKADMSAPAREANNAIDRSRAQSLQAFEQITQQLPQEVELSFSFDDKKAIGGTYDFTWKPQLTNEERQQFQKQTAQILASAGQKPDGNSIETAKKVFSTLVRNAKVEDYIKATLSDFYAEMKQHMVKNPRVNVQTPSGREPRGQVRKNVAPNRKGYV
jgi:hypothetical protein